MKADGRISRKGIAFLVLVVGSVAALFGLGFEPSRRISDFGDFMSPDRSMKVIVTRRERSLVDFEVVDAESGKHLIKDCVGSDAMRWFLFWESPRILWGWGSDVGYFKRFEFDPDGSVKVIEPRDSSTPIPLGVWNDLPSSVRTRLHLEVEP